MMILTNTAYNLIPKLNAFVLLSVMLLSLQIPSWLSQGQQMTSNASATVVKDSIRHANCLWYTARNTGFYTIQNKVAHGQQSEQERALWEQFAQTIGQDECGPLPQSIAELALAVKATAHDANLHFLAQQ